MKPKNELIINMVMATISIIGFIILCYCLYIVLNNSENINTFQTLYLYSVATVIIFIGGFCIFPNIIGGSVERIIEAYKKIK